MKQMRGNKKNGESDAITMCVFLVNKQGKRKIPHRYDVDHHPTITIFTIRNQTKQILYIL